MDVTDDASMVAGIDRIIDEQGRIDVLVNNAGYGSYGAVEDVPIDEARRQFEVNVFGLARLVQLVTPHMRAQESGRIINISSIGGKFYEPFGAWYYATKFAVEGFSDSLRMELAGLFRHPGRAHRARPDPHRVERDRPRLAAGALRRWPRRVVRPAGATASWSASTSPHVPRRPRRSRTRS